MGTHKVTIFTTSEDLRRLLFLRALSIVGQLFAIMVAVNYLEMTLPLIPLALVLSALFVWSFLSYLSLKDEMKLTENAFFVQLCVDVLALTAVLYLTGGATNPFAWFLLVPHSIASTLLARPYAWAMAVTISVAYTAIVFFYQPLLHLDHPMEMGLGGHFQDHIVGMWIGFVLSAFLMAYFVAGMAESLRRRNDLLASMQQKMFRDERLVALGTLAAGAAHELGTPLSTVDIITHELELELTKPEYKLIAKKLKIIQGQVKRCKQALSSITETATQERYDAGQLMPVDVYLRNILNQWRVSHLDVVLEESFHGDALVPTIISDLSISHALINVLDNAAQASPYQVSFSANWNDKEFQVVIEDEGVGVDEEQLAKLGEEPVSSKNSGLGIGLHLSKVSVERVAGQIIWKNRKPRGLQVSITIPLGV
ncbi:MAG: histidine kinase [Cycloclasticus sp. symbiont of Poecilosclerida sp. M]|nr:MAG: histidine kinase [Cycloclasticus sp. symbiont of Poecilosclerida sp. M]